MKPLALLLAIASVATAQDRLFLVAGIDEIAAPGIPGPLCVYGARAFVVATGGYGDRLHAPVVAAAMLGKGRVVAFGHGGYFGKAALGTADTGQFVRACATWASRKDKPGIVAYRLPDVVATLGATSWGGGAVPEGTDTIVLDARGLQDAQRYAAIDTFVRNGGGLLIASLGWGWKQQNPGKDLVTQHAGNRFLSHAGIVWVDGYLKRSSRKGYKVRSTLPRDVHAGAALESGGKGAQAIATLTAAVQSIPTDDKLFLPLLTGMLGRLNLSAKREVTLDDGLARVAFAWQIRQAKNLPPEKVRAHPWADRFPGEARGEPLTLRIPIDTSTPRWHGTGLYARAGTVVTIEIPREAAKAGLSVRIGAHTDRLWQKPTWQRAPEISRRWPLTAAKTSVASAFGGLVYIEVPRTTEPARHTVTIDGAIAAPRFVLGKTTIKEWATVRKHPGPWAELESDRLIITVPSRVVRGMQDPRPLLEFWNRVLDACADLSARPRERTSPERFVVDKQISAGYMHSGYPLMAHLDAAAWLPDIKTATKGNWGLFHEIGHNHQNRDWTFSGTTEVTVNLFTLYVFETVCNTKHPRGNLYGEHREKTIRAYLKRGAKFKEWSKKPFLALLMYMQLQEAFGWDAYRRIFGDYRALSARERPNSDTRKRDQWMVRFSRHVGKNLGPFFEAWGVPTTAKARKSIADLPDWMPPDWPRDE